MDLRDLGVRIANAREWAGLSQTSLGEVIGLDRSAVSRIEAGSRKVAVPEMLVIAEALGRPLSYFVSESVPAVVSRRRDAAHAHATNVLLDEELRSFASDVNTLLDRGILKGLDRKKAGFHTPRDHFQAEEAAGRVRRHVEAGPVDVLDLATVAATVGLVSYSADLGSTGPDGGCVEVGEPGNQLGVAVINGSVPSGRRRMTLAHELGHWLTGDAYDHTASLEAERMINSFAIHLLAPRALVMKIWERHGDWPVRSRAMALGAEVRVSWSAAVGQVRNLGLISQEQHGQLLQETPTRGEFALLGLQLIDEPGAPHLSPQFTTGVLGGYAKGSLARARTLELLRGTLEADDLPPTRDTREQELHAAFEGH